MDFEKGLYPRHSSMHRSLVYGVAALAVLVWGSAFLINLIGHFVQNGMPIEHQLQDTPRLRPEAVFPDEIFSLAKKKVSLELLRDGVFKPNFKSFQWILLPESAGLDKGTYLLKSGKGNETKYEVKSIVDKLYRQLLFEGSHFVYAGMHYDVDDFYASPDLTLALVKTNNTKGWRHSSLGLYWILDVSSQTLEPLAREKVSAALWSPKLSHIAYIVDNNVYVKEVGGPTVQVTHDGDSDVFYGRPDWVYEEEVFGTDKVMWWSPKGDKLSFLRFNDTEVPEFPVPYYVQDGHEDYPKTVWIKYPKPGYPNPKVDLMVYELGGVAEQAAFGAGAIEDKLITEVLWVSDSQLLVKALNRASDTLQKYIVSVSDALETLLVETRHTKGWFEVTSSAKHIPRDPERGREHDGYIDVVAHHGYNHLAYFSPPDSANGVLLTLGRWEVLSSHFDAAGKLYFTATKKSSVERHMYALDLNEALQRLTEPANITDVSAPGWFSGSFSAGSRYLLLTYLGPGVPKQELVDLHTLKTVEVLELNKGVHKALEEFDVPQERYSVVDLGSNEGDGRVLANTVEILPPGFEELRKYPVLFYVYGGPGSQLVTKDFAVSFSHVVAAQLNAVVVTVDGRGTGYNNHDVSGARFKFGVRDRLGYLEPRDQISAAKLWAQKLYVDASRMCIWGWSYGGFLTLKTLETDVERVFSYGMAVAPVTQWRLYDSIYTERYMRTPQENPNGYKQASISEADNFKNVTRFLVMHGSGDDNVHFQNSLRLVDDMNLAGVENFDFMVFPDLDHLIRYHNGNVVVYDRLLSWLRAAFSNDFVMPSAV